MSKNPTLSGMTLQEYTEIKQSGMFYERYPEATGEYSKDCSIIVPQHTITEDTQADWVDVSPPLSFIERAENIKGGAYDAGAHYRMYYKGIQLDPFRLSRIYNLNGEQFTILKKTLVTGNRGYKGAIQDYIDIINAAKRAIEIIKEDNEDD